MKRATLQDVFLHFVRFLSSEKIPYTMRKRGGQIISVRGTASFYDRPRAFRLVRYNDSEVLLIIRIGRYRPRRLRQVGELLEVHSADRVEIWNCEVRWIQPVDPMDLDYPDLFEYYFELAGWEIFSSIEVLNRFAPEPPNVPTALLLTNTGGEYVH